MWAVGVIMYMLLAGKPPFEGRRDADVFDQILHREPDLYEGVWENISKEARVRGGGGMRMGFTSRCIMWKDSSVSVPFNPKSWCSVLCHFSHCVSIMLNMILGSALGFQCGRMGPGE
jgi:serine/threonine protein kinase